MGTIVTRKRSNGTTAYMAKIIITREGKIAHRETETFGRRSVDRQAGRSPDPPLSDVIDRYIAESEKEFGRTKAQVLRSIKTYDIASKRCSEIDAAAVSEFARSLTSQPQTRGNYLSHLASIFTVAGQMWNYPLDSKAMQDAQVVLKRMGITAKSKDRERRPTLAELDLLMDHFADNHRRRPPDIL